MKSIKLRRQRTWSRMAAVVIINDQKLTKEDVIKELEEFDLNPKDFTLEALMRQNKEGGKVFIYEFYNKKMYKNEL